MNIEANNCERLYSRIELELKLAKIRVQCWIKLGALGSRAYGKNTKLGQMA